MNRHGEYVRLVHREGKARETFWNPWMGVLMTLMTTVLQLGAHHKASISTDNLKT